MRIFPLPPSKRSSDVLTSIWRTRGIVALALWPCGVLFALLARLRRAAYHLGLFATVRLPVPIIVVGNIIAGGAGKTPLTLWLAIQLAAAGRKPGIISRGYGGESTTPRKVGAGATASAVGDEPLLLARRTNCPVYVGVDRVAAAQALLAENPDCDLILCDDGLQHYRLARTVEIVVIDRRGLMNGWPLPAGPLREPASRLLSVDAIVLNGDAVTPVANVPVFRMRLAGERFHRLEDPTITCSANDLTGSKLHAVAGIGEPQRFFDHLTALGLDCETHAFPDHHFYASTDLCFAGDAILMTEKDALKCGGLTTLPIWVLPVEARIEPDLARFVLEKIDGPTSA